MDAEEKARRMALRRGAGFRARALPEVHRVTGGAYRVAHACFNCRKSFKITPRASHRAACPNCGGVLSQMGRSFKAPASRNRAQWEKVKRLYAAGFRFSCYRSHCAPKLPLKLSEVEAFVRDNPQHPMRVAQSASD
jgi:DNA-directed RNA polymerase subunit RPC12/RpoP